MIFIIETAKHVYFSLCVWYGRCKTLDYSSIAVHYYITCDSIGVIPRKFYGGLNEDEKKLREHNNNWTIEINFAIFSIQNEQIRVVWDLIKIHHLKAQFLGRIYHKMEIRKSSSASSGWVKYFYWRKYIAKACMASGSVLEGRVFQAFCGSCGLFCSWSFLYLNIVNINPCAMRAEVLTLLSRYLQILCFYRKVPVI